MKATTSTGLLSEINDCYISVNGTQIKMYILPDISDSKGATYADMNGIGRSMPIKVFSHGESRQISWTVHFYGDTEERIRKNLSDLRILESLVYPDAGGETPVIPPSIAKIRCGKMLYDDELCAILKSYSVKFPTDVAWYPLSGNANDPADFVPIKFDVDLQFEVVYANSDLPGAERILNSGG